MKHVIALIVIALFALAPAARAQDFHRNAYGMYAAPVMYGFAKGTRYQTSSSGGRLDFGIYYARAFNAGFSMRLEAKYAVRELDDAEVNPAAIPGPDTYTPFRLSETMVQVPLIIQADRRIAVSDHELRVSVGGGPTFTHVFDQKLLTPTTDITSLYGLKPSESYGKFGLVLDGGTTFSVDRKSDIFLRLRFDIDVSTFGAPDDTSVVRRFWATGFYTGFEYGL
jgi:hypothetical protein